MERAALVVLALLVLLALAVLLVLLVELAIRLKMIKWKTIRIEEILVNNSSLVSGLSEASRVKLSWVEVSQKV